MTQVRVRPTMTQTMDKLKRAPLVIDVQNKYFTGKLAITFPPESLTHILSAMDAARDPNLWLILSAAT